MSHLTMELSQINKTRAEVEIAFKNGEMKRAEYLDYDLKYLAQSALRINAAVQVEVSAAKHGRKIRNATDKQNLTDRNAAIVAEDPNVEMVKCPDKDDQLIARSECLSYSGEEKNVDCLSCENYKITRDILMPRD